VNALVAPTDTNVSTTPSSNRSAFTLDATCVSHPIADSYWIDGYFEETKMAHVCVGDRAEAALLGYRDPIVGR
jgi:multidrug resistance efflux pump